MSRFTDLISGKPSKPVEVVVEEPIQEVVVEEPVIEEAPVFQEVVVEEEPTVEEPVAEEVVPEEEPVQQTYKTTTKKRRERVKNLISDNYVSSTN